MSSVEQHRSEAPVSIRVAVITISDTRTWETDTGGRTVADRLIEAGHEVVERHLIPDDQEQIRGLLERLHDGGQVDAVLLTGGTGITRRDQTYETVGSLLSKTIPGYGELFRSLSYQEIGAAAMLSRAVGGLMGRMVVLTMPGSRAAVTLAMDKIIVPELRHLVREARR